jgi:hypothetical protein
VKHGDYLFMHSSGGPEETFLNGIENLPVPPLAPAITRLLEQAPKDSISIQTMRVLNELAVTLESLTQLENIARGELDDYLAKATAILKTDKAAKEKLAELRNIEPPVLMKTLNMAKDGQPFLTLVGELRYPRPKVMPFVGGLLKDFLARSDAVGGALSYERVQDGRFESSVIFSTEALALLVKSTANAYFETYVNDPAGPAKLREALVAPGDGMKAEGVLLYNPMWDVFDGPADADGAEPF